MKNWTASHEKHDVMPLFLARSVMKTMTSLIYHLPSTILTPCRSRGPPRWPTKTILNVT